MSVTPVVAIPIERTVPGSVFWHFMAIAGRGWPIVAQPYNRTDIARNAFASYLLDHPEFSHLVMLDLDHRHPTDIVERLARWCENAPHVIQMVGGLSFRRREPYDPLMWVRQDGHYYVPGEWDPGLAEGDMIGFGAVMIARSVFEALAPPWFTYDYSRAAEGTWPTEDIGFCQRVRQAGVSIWCDTSTVSPHHIDGWVDESTFRSYLVTQVEGATDGHQGAA